MKEAIQQLREFFRSELWTKAIKENQPVLSDQGVVSGTDQIVGLDTKINLALDFEGKFNDMAAAYMRWRKKSGLTLDKE